jgi:hypothetical protein
MSFTRIVYNKGFSSTRIVSNKGFFLRIVYNNEFIQGLVIIRNFRNKHNITRNRSFSKRRNPLLYTILVVIGRTKKRDHRVRDDLYNLLKMY